MNPVAGSPTVVFKVIVVAVVEVIAPFNVELVGEV
jgi:hypothetical protein